MTAPERIEQWVKRQFNPKHVDMVVKDLIGVATGNREGNTFERASLDKIFPELAWVVMCIPSNDGESGDWFAHNRETRKSVACKSQKSAAETCVKKRRAARSVA